ncbi:MAG: hypothetical protein KKG59_07960 [Nanoarchaeota archaeon]|nr:hypothetical protein [Nanoarchaeota archaeon]
MCAIVAILAGHRPVVQDVRDALFSLEHRGPNSSGMCGYNIPENRLRLPLRGVGRSQEVFGSMDLSGIEWQAIIGHNRYATSGSNLLTDSQPLLSTTPPIAIAHNGEVVNVRQLTEKFSQKHVYFTECDVEHILHSLSEQLNDRKYYRANSIDDLVETRVFPAIEGLFQEVEGAYAVVGMLAPYGMFAFKDPHGIRPLSYAVKQEEGGKVHMFASESTAFNFLGGFQDIRELERGEAVFISFDGAVYSKVIEQRQQAACRFEKVYFGFPDSDMWGSKIYDARTQLGINFGKQYEHLKDMIEVVMAIPNASIPAAQGVAWYWNKPYGGIFSRGNVRSFLQTNEEDRINAILNKMCFIKSRIEGNVVLLMDDTEVRGLTSKIVIKKLYDLGAKEVYLGLTFPPIRHPCVYGIDTPDYDELIAAQCNGDIAEITRRTGAKGVYFLSEENTDNAIGISTSGVCRACVTGQYPTGSNSIQQYKAERKEQRLKCKPTIITP